MSLSELMPVPAVVPCAGRILVVDDEQAQMRALCDTLGQQHYQTTGFSLPTAALKELKRGQFDLLLADLMMPEMDGIDLLKKALAVDPDLVGVLMTGQGTIETAVKAMQAGALDYILKPFKLSAILPVLSRALSIRKLQLENRELSRQLADHAARLEDANRELEAFSHSVSHDLRAPLRAITGFNGLVLKQFSNEIPVAAVELLREVERGARNMAQLIEDLLRLSRCSRQPLHQTPVDAQSLVNEVVAEIRAQNAGRQAEVSVGDLPEVFADRPLLRQVFVNLLSNAFKFTRKTNGMIQVGCQANGNENVFFVRDNGAGFDMAYAEKLFNVFQRLHSSDEFEGTGVGLSIVHRIVQRHGGRIWAQGAVNQGATFYIALPRHSPPS